MGKRKFRCDYPEEFTTGAKFILLQALFENGPMGTTEIRKLTGIQNPFVVAGQWPSVFTRRVVNGSYLFSLVKR